MLSVPNGVHGYPWIGSVLPACRRCRRGAAHQPGTPLKPRKALARLRSASPTSAVRHTTGRCQCQFFHAVLLQTDESRAKPKQLLSETVAKKGVCGRRLFAEERARMTLGQADQEPMPNSVPGGDGPPAPTRAPDLAGQTATRAPLAMWRPRARLRATAPKAPLSTTRQPTSQLSIGRCDKETSGAHRDETATSARRCSGHPTHHHHR